MHKSQFVESYFDAWNHHDPRAVADHLADDGVYFDAVQNVHRTHDDLIVSLSEFFSNFKHQYELIGEILKGRNTVAFQYKTHALRNNNERILSQSYCGAEFFSLSGDAALTITDYYDIPGASPPAQLVKLASTRVQRPKYAKSGLSSKQLLQYKDRLERIMELQQAYLRPDLTLPKLADAVECSVNHLSQVINSGFGMSFFDYVNQFRIDHARELLASPDGQTNAVLNIAFTVGFRSNSAFYAAFRKRVGQTPAQFRRSQSHKTH